MLFFRSGELVRRWCAERGHTPGPVVTMEQLGGLAHRWYSTRLQPDSRRPTAEQIREIFSGLGLTGRFWDPR